MPLGIVPSEQAYEDLYDLWAYVAQDSPAAARNFALRLEHTFALLAEQPKLGRNRSELAEDLRSFPVRRTIIFYRENGEVLSIVRVLSASRDISADDF